MRFSPWVYLRDDRDLAEYRGLPVDRAVRLGDSGAILVRFHVPNESTLEPYLEALVRVNRRWLRENPAALDFERLPIRFILDPRGVDLHLPGYAMVAIGGGDCEDWSALGVAAARERGRVAGFRFRPARPQNGRPNRHLTAVVDWAEIDYAKRAWLRHRNSPRERNED